MTEQDKIDMMYKQYRHTHNRNKKRDLYKGIKRAEAKRRKAKIGGTIIV